MPRLPGLAEKNTQHEQHPEQRQPHARIALVECRLEARHQPEQQQAPRQPQRRDHFDEEVVPAFHVMPGRRITPHGLLEQDLVAIRGVLGGAAGRHREQHGHEPQRDREQHRERREPPAPARPRPRRWTGEPLPPERAQREVRNQQQHGQETHALGEHAESRGESADEVPAPGRPEQQVPQQRVQRERREEAQRRVDLRAARRPSRIAACTQLISAAARPASRLTVRRPKS